LIHEVIVNEIKKTNSELPTFKQIKTFKIRDQEFEKTTTQKNKNGIRRKSLIGWPRNEEVAAGSEKAGQKWNGNIYPPPVELSAGSKLSSTGSLDGVSQPPILKNLDERQ